MTSNRLVASGQLVTGWLFARHPSRALRILGYPEDSALARTTMRVLGARELGQGAAELRNDRTVMRAGAAIDVLHALTCLAYARRSETGRRAGLRSAALAVTFAIAQAAAASRPAATRPWAPDEPLPPARPRPSTSPDLPHVASARASAWPQPSEDEQQILVGTSQEVLVALRGGVMDGATVALAPGTEHYDVIDSDRGPQRYRATAQHTDAGLVVFAREGEDTA